jgi:hypothetical protein
VGTGKDAQILNTRLLEVGPVTRAGLQKIEDGWNQSQSKKTVAQDNAMILTLGHAYLDDLVNAVCSAKVYPQLPLPHEICTKLRTLEGEDHEHWRTLRVEQLHEFTVRSIGKKSQVIQIESRSLADYLAACIDVFPSIRNAVLKGYEQELVSEDAWLLPESVEAFHEQLKKHV